MKKTSFGPLLPLLPLLPHVLNLRFSGLTLWIKVSGLVIQ